MTVKRPNQKPETTKTAAKRLNLGKKTLRDLTPRTGNEVKGGIKTCKTTSNGNQDPGV